MSSTSSTNTESIIIYIDSNQRTSGTTEDFTITLNTPVPKVLKSEIVGAEIPFTFYTINASNNVIVWQDAGATTYTATVPVGSYNVTNFVTELQTTMNAVMAGFTITYLSNNFKLQFANATAFQLDLTNGSGTSTIANIIGLSAATVLGTSAVLPSVINLGGPKYLMITSSRLVLPKITRPFHNTSPSVELYKVTIGGSPGDILNEKNIYTNLLKYGVRQTITSLDFQLRDDTGTVVNLNGASWSLTLNLLTG